MVAVLEALRVLAGAGGGFRPRDTLEFHWYGGEEGGLLGSQDVLARYKADGRTVLALVNQDMAGYSPSGKISLFTDHVDSALTAYARAVAEAYVGETTSGTCGYGCSDHQSAMVNGFRKCPGPAWTRPRRVSVFGRMLGLMVHLTSGGLCMR